MTPLEKALEQVGQAEKPLGSDNIKYNTWYYGHPVHNSDGDSYPWCAVFVNWCYVKSGCKKELKGLENPAYCPSYVEWAKKKKKWKTKPKRGFLVLFDWDDDGEADHIGFVNDVLSSKTIQTVEGNTDNMVKMRTRGTGCVVGYIDANGNTDENAKKTVDEIALEIIDGKWGNGEERKRKLQAYGYSYNKVQKRVNEILKKG